MYLKNFFSQISKKNNNLIKKIYRNDSLNVCLFIKIIMYSQKFRFVHDRSINFTNNFYNYDEFKAYFYYLLTDVYDNQLALSKLYSSS